MLEPSDIFAEVESARPVLREALRSTFVGDDVKWLLTFGNGWALDERAQLTLYFDPDSIRRVIGTVWLPDHPWLGMLRANDALQVRGRIRRVDAVSIELDVLELGIPEPATR